MVIASLLLIVLTGLLTSCGSARFSAATEVGLNDNPPAVEVAPLGETTEPEIEIDEPETDDDPAYTPTVDVNQIMSSPDYGVQVFLYWQEEIAHRDVQLVKDMGFRWIKQEIPWREIEGKGKGLWRWQNIDRIMQEIDQSGLKMIARLGAQPAWAAPEVPFPEIGPPDDLQDFYDYVFAVASRYQGRIAAYQIWNEPNLAREWGEHPPNPAEYADLLKVGYEAVKAADPNALVISAGLAPTTQDNDAAMPDTHFIQELYDSGAQPYFDALGVHAAGYKSPPETDPAIIAATPELNNNDSAPEELRRVYSFRHVEDVRALMVRNNDAAKKIVILEFGWTIDPRPDSPYRWHAVTPEQQDKYLQRAYAYAEANWQPWIGVMSVIYIADPQWNMTDEQTYWSIVYPGYPELRTAPAYYGLLTMPKVAPVKTDGEN